MSMVTADDEQGERSRHLGPATSVALEVSRDDHFLYANLADVAELGVFIETMDPLPIGATLCVRIGRGDCASLELEGTVAWVNPVRVMGENLNPGMGVRLKDVTPELRERLVEAIRTVAYLKYQLN